MTSYTDIQSQLQPSQSSQEVDLADNTATLTVAEAQALIILGVHFGDDDVIIIEDSAANLEALSASDIGNVASMGGSSLVANDRGLDLTLAQIKAIADAGLTTRTRYETFSPISTQDLTASSDSVADEDEGQVVGLAGGGYAIVWKSVDADGSGVFTQIYDASGNRLGSTTLVNTQTSGAQYDAMLTALAGGGYVVTWLSSDGGGSGIFAQRFDALGNKLGVETQVNIYSEASQRNAVVTALAGGGYVVTWQSWDQDAEYWGVFAQVFDADGNSTGADIAVNATGSGIQWEPVITALPDGSFVIGWSDAQSGEGTVGKVRVFGEDGQPLSGEIDVDAAADVFETQAIVGLSDGNIVVTWEDDAGVYARIFSAAGVAVTEKFALNTTGELYTTWNPVVTALPDGRFVAVWQHGQDIYSQVYDTTGNKVGDETIANTEHTTDKTDQVVTPLQGGGFVVTWLAIDQDGSGYGIYAQVFNAAGTKVGSEIQVNAYTLGDQSQPQVTALANGDFVITWRSTSEDSAIWRIYTKTFTQDTEQASLKGTAEAISATTADDVADLIELGVTSVKVSDAGSVSLTEDIAVLLSAVEGLIISGAASVTVTGSGAALDDLSASGIADLKAMGVTAMDVTDGAIALTLAQANAFVAAGLAFAGNDVLTVTMTAAGLAALSTSDLASLAGIGADVFDIIGDAVSLTLARLGEIEASGLKFSASDILTLADSQINVTDLTAAAIAGLAAFGVTRIDLTDDPVTTPATFTLTQAEAFVTAGISLASGNNGV